MAQYRIPIDKESKRFLSHINIQENKRIIFSGPFGSGKTTFLHEFFKESEKYTPIFLRPINYSIASNKDILEYIKVDILYELIKFATIEDIQFSNKELLPGFIASEIYPIVCELVTMIPVIGKPLKNILGILQNSIKQYKEYKEENNKSELSEFNKLVETHIKEKGNIFEVNDMTIAIRNILDKYRTEAKREIVLIIDDLDRIDPEHIFRILNVFACNADCSLYREELNNKFGFDKIMVVCDISNLRFLFAHKYGGSTDFCGYIDKFYSLNIHYFSLKNEIIEALPNIIKNFNDKHKRHGNYDQKSIAQYILTDLILNNLINIRSLHNLNTLIFDSHKYRYNSILIQNDDSAYVIYQILKAIYITDESLIAILAKLKSSTSNNIYPHANTSLILGYFCYFVNYLQTKQKAEDNFTISIENDNYKCEMILSSQKKYASLTNINNKEFNETTNINSYVLIEKALLICKEIMDYGEQI